MGSKYIIPGQPIPLARPRFYGGHVVDSQKGEKLVVGTQLRFVHGDKPMYDGPLALVILFRMKQPKKKKGKYHSSRPDLDNLVKFILDVANGILYKDDAQVAHIYATKMYSEEASTEFTIQELE